MEGRLGNKCTNHVSSPLASYVCANATNTSFSAIDEGLKLLERKFYMHKTSDNVPRYEQNGTARPKAE